MKLLQLNTIFLNKKILIKKYLAIKIYALKKLEKKLEQTKFDE